MSLRILRWGHYPELSDGPKCKHKSLFKKDIEEKLTQTTENKAVKTEADTGVILP